MIHKSMIFLFLLFGLKPMQVEAYKKKPQNYIQVVPVHRTPEPERVQLTFVFPKGKQTESGNPVKVQMRLRGYPLGTNSNFPRAQEVSTENYGQSLHIIVDDRDFFPITGPSIDPYDEDGDYYQSTYVFNLPFGLHQGTHILRAFPARSYGESLKTENSFAAVEFNMESPSESINLKQPYLTYNIPVGTYDLKDDEPLLLDFYLQNCDLSRDGYKVKFSIDGKEIATLTEWRPYYIFGLKSGKHRIQLQLMDRRNKIGSGFLNDVEQTIYIR